MEWFHFVAVTAVGVVAGFVNTVAGGGSSITLPMLMFLGLPAHVANGTNRIAILLQSIVGVGTFQRNKVIKVNEQWQLAVPSAAGAFVGALLAFQINEIVMRQVIAGVMIAMLLIVVFNPDAWIKTKEGTANAKPTLFQYVIFFAIGLYGGFIQVGVGFLLLGGLVMACGHNIVKANAIKVFIVLVYTIIALLVFWVNDSINLRLGLLLGIGSMAGAWAGAKLTIRGGAVYVRYFLIITLVAMIAKLFNLV